MADKRMFSKKLVDSDFFLDMPLSSQCLYFHLSMRADDDGFVDNPKRILKLIGSNDDDLKILITKQFIIPFDNGIIVIKHWKVNNYLRSDRYSPTIYSEQKKLIVEKNGIYYRKNEYEEKKELPNPSNELLENNKKAYGMFKNVYLSDEEYNLLKTNIPKNILLNLIDRFSSYILSKNASYDNHHAVIITWYLREHNGAKTGKYIEYKEFKEEKEENNTVSQLLDKDFDKEK